MTSPSHQPDQEGAPVARSPRAPVRLGKRLAVVAVAGLTLLWLVVFLLFRGGDAPPSTPAEGCTVSVDPGATNRTFTVAPGPWGPLECTRIALEVPQEFVDTSPTLSEWFFKGYDREQVLALFDSAALTPSQHGSLSESARWTVRPDGVVVRPEPALMLGLGEDSRRILYTVLARFEENWEQRSAFLFKPELFAEHFENSGVRPELVRQVQGLLYTQGPYHVFADLMPLLGTLSDDSEKVALVKVVTRQWSYLIRLKVGPGDDLNALVAYWSGVRQAKELRPLLDSLRRVEGGVKLDLVHLLPPFARRRIYTFPAPAANQGEMPQDCHWTSFNFFNPESDERLISSEFVQRSLSSDYEQVQGAPRFGDLLIMMRPKWTVIHSAVYVAADLLYTKNGAGPFCPWMFMKIEDLIAAYSAMYQPEYPLEYVFFRLKPGAKVQRD